jgi:hypothetical protein
MRKAALYVRSRVNAPNMDLPMEKTGLIMLSTGESWSETSRLYVEYN